MSDLLKDKKLWLIVLLCLFIILSYLKTSDDPIHPIIANTILEPVFIKFEAGNNLLKDMLMGVLVSIIFWVFNIYLPQKKDSKRKVMRLNKALKLVLESFDKECGVSHWDKHYVKCDPLGLGDLTLIMEVKESLENNKIFETLGEKYFYEICHESSHLYYFLSISASELSPEHGALWDSITRNVRRIADIYPDWFERRRVDGFKVGKDYSNGELWLNLTEFLENLERWINLNN